MDRQAEIQTAGKKHISRQYRIFVQYYSNLVPHFYLLICFYQKAVFFFIEVTKNCIFMMATRQYDLIPVKDKKLQRQDRVIRFL